MQNSLGSQAKTGPRDRSYKRFILIPGGFHESKYLVEFLNQSLLPGHLDLQGRVYVPVHKLKRKEKRNLSA